MKVLIVLNVLSGVFVLSAAWTSYEPDLKELHFAVKAKHRYNFDEISHERPKEEAMAIHQKVLVEDRRWREQSLHTYGEPADDENVFDGQPINEGEWKTYRHGEIRVAPEPERLVKIKPFDASGYTTYRRSSRE
jgi:hypothetical protein